MRSSPNWPSFLANCARVRTLDSNPIEAPLEFNNESLEALYTVVGNRPIFPHLRSIRIMNNSVRSFFMSSSVKELVWMIDELDRPSPEGMRYRVDNILTRMPGITHLSILANCLRGQFDAELARLLAGLPNLRSIRFTRHTLSPSLFHALMHHPDLREMDITDIDDLIETVDDGVQLPDPSVAWKDATIIFQRPSYRPLRVLGIALPDLVLAHTLFHEPCFAISHLCSLRLFICHPAHVRETHIRDFFAELARAAPSLQELGLSMIFFLNEEFDAEIAKTIDSVAYSTLQPLLRLKLTSFIFEHTRALDITDADIEVLAQSWPAIRVLSLNRHPVVLEPSKLTMRSIISFARWCPQLETLGIYVDGGRPYGEVESIRFGPMMRKLHLGASSFPYKGGDEAWMLMAELFTHLISWETDVLAAGSHPVWDMEKGYPFSPDQFTVVHPAVLQQYDHSWQIVKEMTETFRYWDAVRFR